MATWLDDELPHEGESYSDWLARRWREDQRRWREHPLSDLAAGLEARQLIAVELEEAVHELPALDWRASNKALKRIEETARRLRMVDRALVQLERGGDVGCVQNYLVTWLAGAHRAMNARRSLDQE